MQTLTEGSFARDVNLMVAKAQPKGTQWQFHNAGALLKVTIAGGGVNIKDLNSSVKAVILTDLNGGKLSGDAVVEMNPDGTVKRSAIADNANAKNSVCLSATSATPVSNGDSFYFLVPPGSYGENNKGISLDVHLESGECYCFMNYNVINVTRNGNVLFANNLPVNSNEAYNRTMNKFYTNIETAASEARADDVVMLLREKFSDNSKRQPVFKNGGTLDLNGYGYRGNLFLQNETGTFTVKDGCVWQWRSGYDEKGKEILTDGDIDGEPNATGHVFGGEVVLENVKAAQVWTDGHPYKISNSVIFGGGLQATDANGVDVYAGSVISLVNSAGNATRPVRVYGTEKDGTAVASSRWPIFGADPDFPRSAVTAVGGDFAARKSDNAVTVEPYRPFNVEEGHAPFVWTWSNKPADHFIFYVGAHQHDMQFSDIWYKFPSHYYSTAGKWQNYIEIVQEGQSYYLNDISSFPTSGAAAVEGISVVTARGKDSAGEDYTIPANGVGGGYLFAWIYDGGSQLSGVSTIQANKEYTFSGGPGESYGVTSTNLSSGSKYVSVVYNKTSSSAKWKLLQISGTPPVEPTGISVSPTSMNNLTVGGSQKINVTVTPGGAIQGAGWHSSNPAVASVDADGTVHGIAVGTARVTAYSLLGGHYSAYCDVTVQAGPVHVTGVTLDKSSMSLAIGGTETGTLEATVKPDGADDKSVTWSSNNTGVATVSNGTVTAKGKGTATITVTTNDGGYTATCTVTVKTVTLTPIAINAVRSNDPMQYVVGGSGGNAYGLEVNPDWFVAINNDQKTKRKAKFDTLQNLWDDDLDTSYHTNLDWGDPNGVNYDVDPPGPSWTQRYYKIGDQWSHRYIEVELAVDKRRVKLEFTNSNSGHNATGYKIWYTFDGNGVNDWAECTDCAVGTISTASGATNTFYDIKEPRWNQGWTVEWIRIENTKDDASWTFIGSAFGIAELKLWEIKEE